MRETIAGVGIPDSALAEEVTDIVREATDDLLFHHSRRVFVWGPIKSARRGLHPDPEAAYVGSMFHDLGLTEKYRSTTQRFEVDGADLARDFLLRHGWRARPRPATSGSPSRCTPRPASRSISPPGWAS